MIDSETVRASAAFVAQHAQRVSICYEKVPAVAAKIRDSIVERGYSRASWHAHPLTPKALDASTVDWIFTVDLLNFSFWSDTPYHVVFEGTRYTGYWSLCAAINRALVRGIPVTDARFCAVASDDQLRSIFAADEGTMPMLDERIRLLRDTASTLTSKFDGSVLNLIRTAQGDPFKFMEVLCCNFHSFLDISSYRGQAVFFLKRAQILVADLWACFDGRSFGDFCRIEHLTMFADYRLPQILQALGLIKPSPGLQERLEQATPLNVHEDDVVEIRGCSIHAVELIVAEIRRLGDPQQELNSIIIDFFLWDSIREDPKLVQGIPIHRTRCPFY